MRQWGIALLAACAAALAGCGHEAVVSQSGEVPNGEWAFTHSLRFTADISDTLAPMNYYIQLRHGGDYAYRNLIVYFKTFRPDNTYTVDTVDCPLAAPNGQWLGRGLGDLLDSRVLFKINQRFPMSGTYNFEIQHAMRPDTIHEVFDVGLVVEKAKA